MGVHGFAVYKLVTLLMAPRRWKWPCPDWATISRPCAPRSRRAPVWFFWRIRTIRPAPPIPRQSWLDFARSLPEDVLLVLDEAYTEYQEQAPDFRPLIAEGRAVLCAPDVFQDLRPRGAEGWIWLYRPDIAALLQRARAPFNINAVAQAAAIAALDDGRIRATQPEANRTGLKQLADGFPRVGSHVRAVRRQFHPSAGSGRLPKPSPSCRPVHDHPAGLEICLPMCASRWAPRRRTSAA